MIPYRGNSVHTMKMKNKPISEGYKVWVLGNQGYVWYFLWYSCVTGTECIPKKGQLVNLPVPLELLNTPDDRPVQVPEPYPRWRLLPRPTKCIWCCEHQGSAAPRAKRRKVLAEVMNEANPGTAAYLPQSRAACAYHGVALCRKSDFWDLYHHAQIAQNGHE